MYAVLMDYGSDGFKWLTDDEGVRIEYHSADEAMKGYVSSYGLGNKFEILKIVEWRVITD